MDLPNTLDLTKERLYQQAIKDGLSEEKFEVYSAYQAERAALVQQVLRDIAVACMDTQLLLDDTQRQHLKAATAGFVDVPFDGGISGVSMIFQLFRRARNFDILTPWQQTQFERIFGPIVWGPNR